MQYGHLNVLFILVIKAYNYFTVFKHCFPPDFTIQPTPTANGKLKDKLQLFTFLIRQLEHNVIIIDFL